MSQEEHFQMTPLRHTVGDAFAVYSLERHAENIAQRLEENETLMEDSPESELLRKETLQSMPQCLTVKRHIKSRLLKTVSKKSKRKPLGVFKRTKYQLSIQLSKFQASLKNFTYTFELWYSTLKTVEGHFGSGVASYFKFVRWLFIMNVLVLIALFGFVVVPQVLFEYFGNNATKSANSVDFDYVDILTGDGYLTDTLLYYGHYTNETLQIFSSARYNIPFAYFFTMVVLFFCCFVTLSFSMAWSYRRNFIETEGGVKNVFAHKVFCGWDYGIATKKAADLKSSSLYLEMKELLSDLCMQTTKKPCLLVFWSKTIQVIVNLFIAFSMAGVGYLVWIYLGREDSMKNGIITAVLISTIVLFFPLIFSTIVKYEDYKNPRMALYITLARTFLLGTIIMGVLLVFWITHTSEDICWATSFGKEMYRLVLYDFVFNVLAGGFLGLLQYLIAVKILKRAAGLEFDIARSTLAIIYNQALFWIGILYAPLISVMVVVKIFLIWYIQKVFLLKLCVPSSRSWRAAQTQTVFLILTFLSLMFILAVHGYMIVDVEAPECGPFSSHKYIYEIVIDGLLHLEQNSVFWKILIYFTKPGVIALILIALCVRVYYLRAKAIAQKEMVGILRDMLTWEAKDKEFLLEHISKVTDGQWQYNLHKSRGDANNPTRTFHYEDVYPRSSSEYRSSVTKKYR